MRNCALPSLTTKTISICPRWTTAEAGTRNAAVSPTGMATRPNWPARKPGVRGQIQFHEKRAAAGIGGGGNFADDAFEFGFQRRNAHGEFVAQREFADDGFRHVGFEAERGGIFHVQQWLAGRGQIADIGVLAGDDPGERSGDFGVVEHRLRFRHAGDGDAGLGLGIVEFGLRENFLLEERGQAFQIGLGLLAQGHRLVVARLHFPRVNHGQHFARLHLLAGHDEHLFDLAADLGLDDGAQLGAHRADDFLGGDALFAFDRLATRTVAVGKRLARAARSRLVPATHERER